MTAIRRQGFTLIELLVVILIIGILAGIAIVKTRAAKDKAILATIKADLHSLVVAQEAYFSDNKSYGSLTQIRTAKEFQLSPGNTMAITTSASGFTATGTNSTIKSSIKKCTIRVGSGGSALDGKLTCP
jgi:prepilin-type N-terminal cleavage/methylation domain-containing protein